jgi:hypothetical protein
MASPKNKTVRAKKGKFILFIGDEGAILVYMNGKKVLRRLFAASPEPTNTRSIFEALSNDPNAPISILLDTIDQSFVSQTLPPVTQLSVNKLIKRRMDRDLAADDIKGAIVLGREKTGRKDWNFLMVSAANTPTLSKWIEVIVERSNPFEGIFLLPVEAESYTQKIIQTTGSKSPSQWKLLVTHNKVSGFRQVVFRDGRIIFTRMAQSIGESLPDVIAGNIEQEVINTTEYLKRMGYTEQAGLDTYVIVSEDIKANIDPKKLKSTHVELFTPYEVASALGLEQAAMPEDHFGDVVFASYFGSLRKHKLKLNTPYTEKVGQLTLAITAIKVLGVLASIAIVLYIGSTAYNSFVTHQAIEDLEEKKKKSQSKLEDTQELMSGFPMNIGRISDIVDLHTVLTKPEMSPFWVIRKIHNTLETMDGRVYVKDLKWNAVDPFKVSATMDERKINVEVEVEFSVKSRDPKELGELAANYLEIFKKEFIGFDVTNSKLPGILGENEALVLGETPAQAQNQDTALSTVRFTIIGSPNALPKPKS